MLIRVMSREEKWKVLERMKLIYTRKDMKLPVGQKTIHLQGRRREQGVELKFEETEKKFGESTGGQRYPMRIFICLKKLTYIKYTNANCIFFI